ncbi:MAG: DUF4870 domain-containing protein [Candidatus Bilamarchaeaceae archaeon]
MVRKKSKAKKKPVKKAKKPKGKPVEFSIIEPEPAHLPSHSLKWEEDSTLLASLSYLLGPISGIGVYVATQDKFARFHALQSTFFSVFAGVLGAILFMLSFVSLIPTALMSSFIPPLYIILVAVVWVFLIYKASRGKWTKIPILGDFAGRHA